MVKQWVRAVAWVVIETGILVMGFGSSRAAHGEDSGVRCEALANTDFSGIMDAPAQLTEARVVAASAEIPAYCEVNGYVSPSVGIELRLPLSHWNGKFVQAGCGGFCGARLSGIFSRSCDNPLRKGYACIASDMGHRGRDDVLDGLWAYNNLQAEVDFGYRATHVTALAGKAIAAAYYGAPPARSYFVGCSTGGRQGMVEAQKFPEDFAGIVAGAPAMNFTGLVMNLLWDARALHDENRKPLLSEGDLQMLHRAALARCDGDDGLKDGLIGDPRTCRFDPSELVCKPGAAASCLSEGQAAAIKKIYAGPSTSTGERLVPGGAMPGSELNFANYYYDYGPGAAEFFRYLGFFPDPGPSWQPGNFDFDRDHERLGMMESLYASTNPDLRKFKAAGGKLLVYQGWNDEAVKPLSTIDYYETVERTMGGRAATQDFFRLFMLPGVGHCAGGEGAYAFDSLGYLEAWAEAGNPPGMIVAAHLKSAAEPFVTFPLAPSAVDFSRPAYPYPLQAKYRGRGDPNSAASFQPSR